MAARTKKRSKRSGLKVSITSVAGFAPLGITTVQGFQERGAKGALENLSKAMTGYSPELQNWEFARMKRGAIPIVVSQLVRKLLNKLGASNALRGIPFVGV